MWSIVDSRCTTWLKKWCIYCGHIHYLMHHIKSAILFSQCGYVTMKCHVDKCNQGSAILKEGDKNPFLALYGFYSNGALRRSGHVMIGKTRQVFCTPGESHLAVTLLLPTVVHSQGCVAPHCQGKWWCIVNVFFAPLQHYRLHVLPLLGPFPLLFP